MNPDARQRADPWTDGDVIAVALQYRQNFAPVWSRLAQTEPALVAVKLDQLLDQLRSHGLEPDRELDPAIEVPLPARPAVDELVALIQQIRRAGERVFDATTERPEWLACTTAFPREYFTPPPESQVPPAQVQILNLGDIPPHHPAWRERARVGRCTGLRLLYLYGCPLGSGPLDIELRRLDRLEVLDLRASGLFQPPPELPQVPQLKALYLGDNPLREIGCLAGLPSLKYLDCFRTALPHSALHALRRSLPRCSVRLPNGVLLGPATAPSTENRTDTD